MELVDIYYEFFYLWLMKTFIKWNDTNDIGGFDKT